MTKAPCCRRLTLLILFALCSRVQPRHAGDELMQSSPSEGQMSSQKGDSPDVIGKVFFAVGRDVRQCLVCGELFTRTCCRQSTLRWIAIHFWSYRWFTHQREGRMSLKKEYVRDGNRRIIGSVTTGYTDTSPWCETSRTTLPGARTSGSTRPATHAESWFRPIPPIRVFSFGASRLQHRLQPYTPREAYAA